MTTAQMDTVLRHLHQAVLRQDGAGWTDGQLLASFIEQKDEAAFEALLRRHGPMVFGVCRRIIGNHHDAEDAFQATFLVLARKASSVRPRERVANWLHGVALRTALKAKATIAKRRGREKQVAAMPEPEAVPQDPRRDLQPLIDQELNGLPEKYRLPVLLCDLEGRTVKEATRQLGWPQGTVAGRLARGRKLLAKRLANRAVVPSAGPLAAAGVPASLMSSTVKAASVLAAGQATVAGLVPAPVAALMEGVLNTMFLTKLKGVLAVTLVLAVLAGIGAGLLGSGPAAGQQSAGTKAEAVAPPKEPARSDKDQLLGKWLLVSCKCNGKDRREEPWSKDARLVIEEADGKLVCKTVFKDKAKLFEILGPEEMEKRMLWADMAGESPEKVIERFGEEMEKNTQGILKLDARTNPKTLDVISVVPLHGIYLAIYKLDGDTLTWCWSKALTPEVAKTGKDRPTDFSTTSGDGRTLTVYKRQKEHAENDTAKDQAVEQGSRNGAKHDTAKTDLDRLQGIWSVVSAERGGKPSKLDKIVFMVDGKRACLQGSDGEMQGGLYLGPTSKPKTFDLAMSTRTIEGIYSLEGDTLRLCYDPRGAEESKRPGGFLPEKGSPQVLFVLKRTHGAEVFPYRLPDGTRVFPTIIEKKGETPPSPPQIAPQPKDSKPNYGSYDPGSAAPGSAERTAKVGKIIVVGNAKTATSVILKMIPLSPGDVLDYQALRTAEKNLAAFSPTITVEESGDRTDCKDVRVTIKEK